MTKELEERVEEDILRTIADIYGVDVDISEASSFIRVAAEQIADLSLALKKANDRVEELEKALETTVDGDMMYVKNISDKPVYLPLSPPKEQNT